MQAEVSEKRKGCLIRQAVLFSFVSMLVGTFSLWSESPKKMISLSPEAEALEIEAFDLLYTTPIASPNPSLAEVYRLFEKALSALEKRIDRIADKPEKVYLQALTLMRRAELAGDVAATPESLLLLRKVQKTLKPLLAKEPPFPKAESLYGDAVVRQIFFDEARESRKKALLKRSTKHFDKALKMDETDPLARLGLAASSLRTISLRSLTSSDTTDSKTENNARLQRTLDLLFPVMNAPFLYFQINGRFLAAVAYDRLENSEKAQELLYESHIKSPKNGPFITELREGNLR